MDTIDSTKSTLPDVPHPWARAHAAMGPGADLEGWTSKVISFRYSLSYVKLFEVTFNALVDPRPFDPGRPLDAIEPPVAEIPANVDVVVARHQVLSAAIPTLVRLPRMLRYAPRQLHHYYTDLSGGPERAFRSMSSKTRSTVNRKVRAFEAFSEGEIRWRIYKTPDEMLKYHRLAREVAARTYQERLFDAGLPDSDSFRREMVELASQDLVRAFILFHQEKPIAYLYTPAPDGRLTYEYLGYDPDYAGHSPGTVLQYLALKALHEEARFPLYYWGYGYSQTKQIFSTGQVLAADIYYFRPTLRSYFAILLHVSTDWFSAKVGAVLDRLRLKERVKRWLKRT